MAVEPDASLTADCNNPELIGDTWRDVAIFTIERGNALCECTQRMRTLRGDEIGECE